MLAEQQGGTPERLVATPYGTFSTQDIVFAHVPGGKEMIVHGRHRLAGIVATGKTVPAVVQFPTRVRWWNSTSSWTTPRPKPSRGSARGRTKTRRQRQPEAEGAGNRIPCPFFLRPSRAL